MFSSSLHRSVRLVDLLSKTASVAIVLAHVPCAQAATIAPPMLDIAHQCDLVTRHNTTAMSECVVAESEARADLLQNWAKLPDKMVEKCIKIGRQAKRQPYTAMEKCLAPDIAAAAAPPPVAAPKK